MRRREKIVYIGFLHFPTCFSSEVFLTSAKFPVGTLLLARKKSFVFPFYSPTEQTKLFQAECIQ
jgi:hypothetical protein